MRIKMLKTAASAVGVFGAGTVVDVNDDFAAEMVRRGAAEYVDAPATDEIAEAVAPPVAEQAVRRGRPKRN